MICKGQRQPLVGAGLALLPPDATMRCTTANHVHPSHPPTHAPTRPHREVGVKVPLIVRLEGTNVEKGKEILRSSGVNLTAADDLDDAATKAVASIA